jgi:co-chaperonin GroES (HSP10)
MTLGGGDKLAKGARTAQFGAGVVDVDAPIELHNVAPEEFTVTDKRPSYLDTRLQEAEVIKPVELKFPEPEYTTFKTILDRVLVKRVPTDKNVEVLSDGSLRDKRTGFIIPSKYRQHSNVGVVVAIGDFVTVGGVKVPMEDIVNVRDRVTYGEYNAEAFTISKEKAQELCDDLRINYSGSDEETFWIVRVQDIRGVERFILEEYRNG